MHPASTDRQIFIKLYSKFYLYAKNPLDYLVYIYWNINASFTQKTLQG